MYKAVYCENILHYITQDNIIILRIENGAKIIGQNMTDENSRRFYEFRDISSEDLVKYKLIGIPKEKR